MIISFIGHSFVSSVTEVKLAVKEQIKSHIKNNEPVICYLGGYGQFDELCAYACKELKVDYDQIRIFYITPYISLSAQKKIKEIKNGK